MKAKFTKELRIPVNNGFLGIPKDTSVLCGDNRIYLCGLFTLDGGVNFHSGEVGKQTIYVSQWFDVSEKEFGKYLEPEK